MVDAPDECTERRGIDVLDALVGVVRRGDVRDGEDDAGDHLDDDQEQACAAERMQPAHVARHGAIDKPAQD